MPFIGDKRELTRALITLLQSLQEGMDVVDAASLIDKGICSWVQDTHGLHIPSLREENYGLVPLLWDNGETLIFGSLYFDYTIALAHIKPDAGGRFVITDIITDPKVLPIGRMVAILTTYISFTSSSPLSVTEQIFSLKGTSIPDSEGRTFMLDVVPSPG